MGNHRNPDQGQQNAEIEARRRLFPEELSREEGGEQGLGGNQDHRAGDRRVGEGGDPGAEMQRQENPRADRQADPAARPNGRRLPEGKPGEREHQNRREREAVEGDDQSGGLAEANQDGSPRNGQDRQGQHPGRSG